MKALEQIIRDTILSYWPDAELYKAKSWNGYDGEVEIEGFGFSLVQRDKEPSIAKLLKVYHFSSESEGYNINQCMEEVLEDIRNIDRPNIKKLFIRLIQVCSEKEVGTGLVNHKVCARFSLSFDYLLKWKEFSRIQCAEGLQETSETIERFNNWMESGNDEDAWS